ncbi:Hypothetical protein TFLO_2749 [Trichococcus flocculiformis]|uniref:Uncharacterized protein n=1 Tax=Trichococcus flocculiformis TaxID=82803 RepID=A0AB38BKQ7_9LACT|nr:hypothetical protein [Trichococcus flocculiformis]CZR02513.1 Hypothetical protein TFLO_2749 [Trichococcus flocculiformis]SFI10540.1 hypothetical protein SAMN04488507_10518 [Trichococcus flocculiformis]
MNKKSGIIKEGLLVTIASLLTLAVAFMLYFLIFMVFESFANQDGSYGFVSSLRVGYGILWLGLCLIVYRTTLSDWLKASVLTASLTTFMVGIGVQLYKSPIVVGLVLLLVASISVFLLHKMKQKWYHYYAVALSILAALFYL